MAMSPCRVSVQTRHLLALLALVLFSCIRFTTAWVAQHLPSVTRATITSGGHAPSVVGGRSTDRVKRRGASLILRLGRAAQLQQPARAEAVLSSGLDAKELSLLLEVIADECQQLGIGAAFHHDGDGSSDTLVSVSAPVVTPTAPGTLGRVLLLRFSSSSGMDEHVQSLLEELEAGVCERVDHLLQLGADDDSDDRGSEGGAAYPALKESALVWFMTDEELIKSQFEHTTDETEINNFLSAIVENHIQHHELRSPLMAILPTENNDAANSFTDTTTQPATYTPSIHVELDGGYVSATPTSNDDPITTYWDASSLLVFDNLVDDDLRKRLLDVVLGADSSHHDASDGPTPDRWLPGQLMDHDVNVEQLGDNTEHHSSTDHGGIGWGLSEDALNDICFGHHRAFEELETALSALFPGFVVTRLPEAVLGASVTPLTANAPTAGDVFDYHVDADPNATPSSPWTDVYGRYPNRAAGKPRFVSCLVYLNAEWDGAAWGAPTRFVDVPTADDLTVYDVEARPGRLIIMDQDVGHTVVAPHAAAGQRPRYSLVWKLVLHPRSVGQDMKLLAQGVGRKALWPDTEYFGSAALRHTSLA